MAKQGAEARPLETGPEQQTQNPKAAPDGANKAALEKGVAEVRGILKVAPEQMVAEPAALETLPALEPGRWEKVKGWTSGVLGKMREAFKKPVPPTLEQLHDQQIGYIEKFLDSSKLSPSDRENLRDVILNHLDANERNPAVIAEKMKAVLFEHQQRMKQMDVIAKKMQGAIETGKPEELGKEMMTLDPETMAAVNRTYEKLKALPKTDLRNPDQRAQTQWELLTNPAALANFLRQDIPQGESLTNVQLLDLAKTLVSAMQTEDLQKRHTAAKEKAEKERQEQDRIVKMKKVAYFINKYKDAQEPDDDKVDTFLQRMVEREELDKQMEEQSKGLEQSLEKDRVAKNQEIGKLIEGGRRVLNLEKVIQDAYHEATQKNFDKAYLSLGNSLAAASDMIDRDLVTVSKSGELDMNADPKEMIRRIDIFLDADLVKNGVLLSAVDKARIRDLLKSEVIRKYNEKLAKLATTIPESQRGKKQVMEYMQGERAGLEANKTDRLQSIDAIFGQNLNAAQEKLLDERRKENDIHLALDKDFAEMQKKGWADTGPDGKRRMTAKGLISIGAPHWSELSVEARDKITELQNQSMDVDKKIQANSEKLAKVHGAYEKIQDQVVDDLQKARDGLFTKFKDQPVDEEAKKHFLELVKTNLAENKMPDIYEALAKEMSDDIDEHNSKLLTLEEEPEDLSHLMEEDKAVPPPTPDIAIKKAKEKEALKAFEESQGIGLSEAATLLKEKGKSIEALSLSNNEGYLNDLIKNAEEKGEIIKADDKELKEILTDVKQNLQDYPASANAIEKKILNAIAEANKMIEAKAALGANIPANDNAQVKDVLGANIPANDNAQEPLPNEVSGVRRKPEAPAESEKDKLMKQALEKLNTVRSYGVGRLAEDIRNLGDKTDNVAANDLMQLNEELTDIMHRARGAGSEVNNAGEMVGADIEAGEDLIDDKTIEPILTGLDEVLSVYSPEVSKAAQKKVKDMVAEHNKKVEAAENTTKKQGEPPMAETA